MRQKVENLYLQYIPSQPAVLQIRLDWFENLGSYQEGSNPKKHAEEEVYCKYF